MKAKKLFHVSENPDIKVFNPRPSPSFYEQIKDNVVFAINDELLHNYLLPRDCPRIGFYSSPETTTEDALRFFADTDARYVVVTESKWYPVIKKTKLYCYEFPVEGFELLDPCAGYYISYHPVTAVSVSVIADPVAELLKRDVELRFTKNLWKLADSLKSSTMSFSMIRMRNAKSRDDLS